MSQGGANFAEASTISQRTFGEATVVWFGVTSEQGGGISNPSRHVVYHRLWSDGRLEMRYAGTVNGCQIDTASCDWTLVPAGPSGNAHACRADIDGDQEIGVNDLLSLIEQWNADAICEPTHACIDLGNMGRGAS
jgi:hypothetical protein